MARTGKRSNTSALILQELGRTEKPLSAYDLLDKLRPFGVSGPPTIYRALDQLLASGKVHRLESMSAFVACRGLDHGTHDHAHDGLATGFTICDSCGTVAEFEDPMLRERIEADAAAATFRPRSSVVEIRGLCAACDAGTSDRPSC